VSTEHRNPRTKSWQQLLALVESEGWPIPDRIAKLLDLIANVDGTYTRLPPLGKRRTDTELARLLVGAEDPVAVIRAEDEVEAQRDALRRTLDMLGNYSRHVSTSALPRVIRDSAEELLGIASEQAALVMAEARPHVEVLERFAARGYRQDDIVATGSPEEVAAAQAVEVLQRRFTLALNLWMQAARTALSRAGGRAYDALPDLGGGVAWTNPDAASREDLADPESVRLVRAAAHPAGFSLPDSYAELKRRQVEADRARFKERNGVESPEVLVVDRSVLSDEAAA